MVRRMGLALTLIAAFLFVGPTTVLAVGMSELKGKTRDLRQRNAILKERLGQQRALTEQLVRRIDALESKGVAFTKEIQVVATRPAALMELPEMPTVVGPQLTIKGFGDFAYTFCSGRAIAPRSTRSMRSGLATRTCSSWPN